MRSVTIYVIAQPTPSGLTEKSRNPHVSGDFRDSFFVTNYVFLEKRGVLRQFFGAMRVLRHAGLTQFCGAQICVVEYAVAIIGRFIGVGGAGAGDGVMPLIAEGLRQCLQSLLAVWHDGGAMQQGPAAAVDDGDVGSGPDHFCDHLRRGNLGGVGDQGRSVAAGGCVQIIIFPAPGAFWFLRVAKGRLRQEMERAQAVARGAVEGCLACVIRGVRVGPAPEQRPDQPRFVMRGGEVEGLVNHAHR